MTRGTRSEYVKHPHNIHVYSTIRRNGCLCGCFTRSNTLDCTSQGEYNHPRVGNDHAQSTAILGSGGKVSYFRYFCIRFQFLQLIPETVRQQNSINYPYLCTSYPTQSLKNLHRKKGGGCLELWVKIYRSHGSLYAKQTFNRIAANDCFKLNLANAAEIPNSVKLHHVAAWKTKWLDWTTALF
jgi:hypothetical protein